MQRKGITFFLLFSPRCSHQLYVLCGEIDTGVKAWSDRKMKALVQIDVCTPIFRKGWDVNVQIGLYCLLVACGLHDLPNLKGLSAPTMRPHPLSATRSYTVETSTNIEHRRNAKSKTEATSIS